MPRLHISKKMSTNKKVLAAIAIVLTISLLMGGALAYSNFKQHAINRFHGTGSPDILLHDDFDGENKHVYVENTGDSPMIVRVQFAEFLQIGNKPIIPGTTVTDPLTWPVRTFDALPGPGGIMPPDAPANDFYHHIWYMTGKGGIDKIYKPGTGEMGYFDFSIDKIFEDGTKAQYALPSNNIMLLADYLVQRDDPGFDDDLGRWVLDTDGWCYWTKLLEPGAATNLLLEKVVVNPSFKPDDNYNYSIDVRLQSTNITEAHMFDKVIISLEAKKLIDIITEGTDGGGTGGGTILPAGAIGVGLDKTLETTFTDPVTWSINPGSLKDRNGDPITDPAILALITVNPTGTVSVGLGVPLGVTFDVLATLDGSPAQTEVFPLEIDRLYYSAIPDSAFRSYLANNFGNGTMITMSQADQIKEMHPTGLGIGSLSGIEYFPNLEILNCSNNNFTSTSSNPNEVVLDLRAMANLKSLNCTSCNLSELILSNLEFLKSLDCTSNRMGNDKDKPLKISGSGLSNGSGPAADATLNYSHQTDGPNLSSSNIEW